MSISRIGAAIFLAAGLASAGGASAQVNTWNFGDQVAPGSCPTAGGTFTVSFGNNLACSVQPAGTTTSLNVKAFSNTNTSTANGASVGDFQTAAINYHGSGSGIGVANQAEGTAVTSSPNHAMDNSTPGADLLMLSFVGGPQILKTVQLGWRGEDADFQVLRWTGAGVASVAGQTAAELLTAGWALTSTVNGAGAAGGTSIDASYNVNGSNFSSSYWLITAFNSGFGGTAPTAGVDAMKVLSVAAQSAVSAPGTLALAGLGLFAAAFVRRRRAA